MTLVVNLFGGPCSGKSVMAAGLFYYLKKAGKRAEIVVEYAKELVYEDRVVALQDQIAIFAEQRQRVNRLVESCEVIVTDSPALLCGSYHAELFPDAFRDLLVWDHLNKPSLDIFVERAFPYVNHGRHQTEDQAKEVDRKMRERLIASGLDLKSFPGTDEGLEEVMEEIRKRI